MGTWAVLTLLFLYSVSANAASLVWDSYKHGEIQAIGFVIQLMEKDTDNILHRYYIQDITKTTVQLNRMIWPDMPPEVMFDICIKAFAKNSEEKIIESSCSNIIQWTRPGPIQTGFGMKLEK